MKFFGHGDPPEPLPETGMIGPPVLDDGTLLSTGDFAELMGFDSTAAVLNDIACGRIIAWRDDSTRWRIPVNQLGPSGHIDCMPGLIKRFASPAIAWFWLNRPNRNTNRQTPLERLREGAEEEVLLAATMYQNGAFT